MWNDLGKLYEPAKNTTEMEKCVRFSSEEETNRTECFESIRNVLILTDAWINYATESIALDEWMTVWLGSHSRYV